MRKKILILLAILFLAVGCTTTPVEKESETIEGIDSSVTIGEQTIFVEVTRTQEEREQGLMHRESLAVDHGMIFVFESMGVYSFWMKNTLIPLDIIWINGDRIVHIEHNLPPGEGLFPKSYTPDASANFVLEVGGGLSQQFGWKVGDEVLIRI